jgi:hypothetical protein
MPAVAGIPGDPGLWRRASPKSALKKVEIRALSVFLAIWFILRRMRNSRLAFCLILVATILAALAARAQSPKAAAEPPVAVASAFQKYWAAANPAAAAQIIPEIEKSGVTFDDAWRILRQGRTYSAQPSGVLMLNNHTEDDLEHFYAVNVPANYDPSKKYQVRFQLHGGINARQDNKPRNDGNIGTLAGADGQFYVLPYAWDHSPWWGDDQIQNLNAIVDSLKRSYNIDENRVVLSGVSDGATGSYFIAMRDTTPFASFLPLNGFIMVLANEEIDDGKIYPNNLVNKPLYVVNGGKDPLYPAARVEPFTMHLMQAGVEISYAPQPEGEHNTKWWPQVKGEYERFVTEHPRDPNPAKLTWRAGDLTYNRAHWLVIDKFGSAPGEAKMMDDANNILVAVPDAETEAEDTMFGTAQPVGRVDAERKGNTVTATTTGVTAFTVLLSPDVFDFNQPVRVVANGREVFNGRVERSLPTLLKWAAHDNDRTMLYAAELHIDLTH